MAITKKDNKQYEMILMLYLVSLVASVAGQTYSDKEIINDKRLRLKYVIGDLILKALEKERGRLNGNK